MNIEEISSKLENQSLPQIQTPQHQAVVRFALEQSLNPRSFNFWEKLKEMTFVKKLGAGVVMAALIFAVSFAISAYDTGNVASAAHEAVDKAFIKSAKLTLEQRQALSEKMESDLMASLAEAKQAADLTYLTPEQFNAEMSPSGEVSVATGTRAFNLKFLNNKDEKDPELKYVSGIPVDPVQLHQRFKVAPADFTPGEIKGLKVFEPAKYLRYTDSHGQVVYLGIDENDVPVMKMIKMSEEQIKQIKARAEIVDFHAEGSTDFGFTPAGRVELE